MKAKLTNKHTLYIDQARASTPKKLTPKDPQFAPGTWGTWLLDDSAELVSGSQFELGFGSFDEDYKRAAYDKSAALLNAKSDSAGMIPFTQLLWEPISPV